MDIEIEGAEQLAAVSKRLRAAGEQGKGLRKELRTAIAAEAKPLGRFIAVSAGANLPRRGGLGYRVGGAAVSTNIGAMSARVKLKVQSWDLPALDRGRLRHPVFGNRQVWRTQKVKPKTFTTPFESVAPKVRGRIVQVMDDVAKRIEG